MKARKKTYSVILGVAATIASSASFAKDMVHIDQVPKDSQSLGNEEMKLLNKENDASYDADYQSNVLNNPQMNSQARTNVSISEPNSGGGNVAVIKQNGKSNTASVKQSGDNNYAKQTQKGKHNDIDLEQNGKDNVSVEEQDGNYNHKVIKQNDDEYEETTIKDDAKK